MPQLSERASLAAGASRSPGGIGLRGTGGSLVLGKSGEADKERRGGSRVDGGLEVLESELLVAFTPLTRFTTV